MNAACCNRMYHIIQENSSVERTHDTYRREDIDQAHRVGAGLFVPFTIPRLRAGTEATEATLTVALRHIGDDPQRQHTLHLA